LGDYVPEQAEPQAYVLRAQIAAVRVLLLPLLLHLQL
jgi:hypothetical protein